MSAFVVSVGGPLTTGGGVEMVVQLFELGAPHVPSLHV
jgi:hypothetical protein